MSNTYNIQTRQFATSGTKPTRDGAPLSSMLGIDVMAGLNNMAYTQPFFGYVQSFNTKRSQDYLGNAYTHQAGMMGGVFNEFGYDFPNGEYFLAQVPTVMPTVNAKRLCWTLGLYPLPANAHTGDITIANVHLYVASGPYVAPVNGSSLVSGGGEWQVDTAFDATKLVTPYGKSTNACNIVIPNPTTDPGYQFVDQSAGTVGDWTPKPNPTHPDSFNTQVHLILTADISHVPISSGESNIGIFVSDFSWWVNPE